MMVISDAEIIRRLLLAALIGGALGFEREVRQKSAGLRTNILIAVGSAIFTLLSFEFAAPSGGDPSRIAAQIVTGIGFLGAGAIMRTDQGGIHGLTTAATVWVNASLGMAAGAGRYRLAIFGAALTAFVLFGLPPFERVVDRLFWNRPGAGRPPRPPATGV